MREFFDKNGKKAIIYSVMGAAIFAILQLVWGIVSNYSGSIIDSIINHYYYRAGSVVDNELSIISFAIMLTIFAGMVLIIDSISIKNNSKKIKVSQKMNDYEKTELPHDATPEEKREIIEKRIQVLKEAKQVATDNTVSFESVKSLKRKRISDITHLCFSIFFIVYTFIFTLIPSSQKSYFEREIIKITPYVEAHEIDMLKSDWVLMKSREDYLDIRNRINAICDEYDLW
ncbi:MAG: hypothetical protein FWD34_03455 [Oscillospiraceae bacterium]|nr:hypothetical protein [Oscillospiraceae bacterium]